MRNPTNHQLPADSWIDRCHFGDVRVVLNQMIADGVKVNCIVTSPPYWGLRSYLPSDHSDKSDEIGSEPTLREFLVTMVGVFDLARQVLADDGTMWVNMGDCYISKGSGPNSVQAGGTKEERDKSIRVVDKRPRMGRVEQANRTTQIGLKPKDIAGQPWRLVFALQDAGWWLRQDIIWSKSNPMPESMTDRCTKSHEYIFLLSKSERYYFDQEAIAEPVVSVVKAAHGVGFGHGSDADERSRGRVRDQVKFSDANVTVPMMRNKRSVWTVPTESYAGAHFATFPKKLIEPCILAGCPEGGVVLDIFFGSGTTGEVAQALGRHFIGVDLDARNDALQRERLRQPSLMLAAA